MLTLEIRIEVLYGREIIYPCDEQTKLLCKFAGQASLTRDQLTILHELGYKIRLQKVRQSNLPDFIEQDTYK